MEKSMLFIMNPVSGQKKANRVLPELLQSFNAAGYKVTVYMTTGPGTAAQAAQRWGAEQDLVVCCGGDGTLNETLTGLLRAGIQTNVGYIPAGTTNDFASTLKLSTNPLQAARDILEGTPMPVDVGQFGERYFSYVASFGAFTRASYEIPQDVKNALGHAAYVLGGISELSQIRKEHLVVEIDGEVIEDDFIFGAICNATSIGGILTLDPKQVDLGDGRFEVLLLRHARSLEEVAECIQALQSQKYNCAMLTFRSAREIIVRGNGQMPWSLDGERADGAPEIHISNIHHGVHLVCRRSGE